PEGCNKVVLPVRTRGALPPGRVEGNGPPRSRGGLPGNSPPVLIDSRPDGRGAGACSVPASRRESRGEWTVFLPSTLHRSKGVSHERFPETVSSRGQPPGPRPSHGQAGHLPPDPRGPGGPPAAGRQPARHGLLRAGQPGRLLLAGAPCPRRRLPPGRVLAGPGQPPAPPLVGRHRLVLPRRLPRPRPAP